MQRVVAGPSTNRSAPSRWPRPAAGAIPRYLNERRRSWAEQWPFECIWKARKHVTRA